MQNLLVTVSSSLSFGLISARASASDFEMAYAAFEKATTAAQAELVKQFEAAIQKQAFEPALASKSKMVDVLNAEKERFQKSEMIPWSEAMRNHTLAYQKAMKVANADLEPAYTCPVSDAIMAKNQMLLAKLQITLSTKLDHEPVANLMHQAPDKPPVKHALFLNCHIDTVDGKATWSLENGKLVFLKSPNPQAPGGAWIDTCEVTKDGLNYSGRNQKRH